MHHPVSKKTDTHTEGKGLNGFLLDWHYSRPRGVVAKPQRQILSEFFTSMLILSASFKYKPAVATANYLYCIDDEWSLSLIAPDEWDLAHRDGFAGRCELQADMTWTIEPSSRLLEDTPVAAAVQRFYEAFATMLDTDLTLEEVLPFYANRLPYYQRLFAAAMSRSLRATVRIGGDRAVRCRDWALPRLERVLLPQRPQA